MIGQDPRSMLPSQKLNNHRSAYCVTRIAAILMIPLVTLPPRQNTYRHSLRLRVRSRIAEPTFFIFFFPRPVLRG